MEVRHVGHFGDEKLISKIAGQSRESEEGPGIENLLKWGHLSPLEFASITFYIKCPIYVARQIMRHRTGKYMERSLRYLEHDGLFHMPPIEDKLDKHGLSVRDSAKLANDISWRIYKNLLDNGVPKEQARAVLPMGLVTHFYVQFDLRNLINFLTLRMSKDTQAETRYIAEMMHDIVQDYFPTIADYVAKELDREKEDS